MKKTDLKFVMKELTKLKADYKKLKRLFNEKNLQFLSLLQRYEKLKKCSEDREFLAEVEIGILRMKVSLLEGKQESQKSGSPRPLKMKPIKLTKKRTDKE